MEVALTLEGLGGLKGEGGDGDGGGHHPVGRHALACKVTWESSPPHSHPRPLLGTSPLTPLSPTALSTSSSLLAPPPLPALHWSLAR